MIFLFLKAGLWEGGTQGWEGTPEQQLERTRLESKNGFQYASPDENYDITSLEWDDRQILEQITSGLKDHSRRATEIKRLYNIRGDLDWTRHIESLDEAVSRVNICM